METETVTHDTVFHIAQNLDAGWIASILFDIDGREGCNGIWAVALMSDSIEDARSKVMQLRDGIPPAGISPHNEYTRGWLDSIRLR